MTSSLTAMPGSHALCVPLYVSELRAAAGYLQGYLADKNPHAPSTLQ